MNIRTMGACVGLAALLSAPEVALGSPDWDLPDRVQINRLAQYYGGVDFDHESHLDLAPSCGACHHHTTGGAPESEACATCHHEGEPASTVSCTGCHAVEPFSAVHMAEMESGPQWFHVDKPGLKGAYHRSCLGCHETEGAPTGCQDCHARTAEGDTLFRASAGGGSSAPGRHH